MFHGKPIPSLGELRIVWKLSNLGACLELCVRQRLLNKIRIRTEETAQVPHRMDVQPDPPPKNRGRLLLLSSHKSGAAGTTGKTLREVTCKLIGQSQKTLELFCCLMSSALQRAPFPALIYSS